jgi:hypothetical protein
VLLLTPLSISSMEVTIQPFFIATILQAFFYVLYLISLVCALRWLLYKEDGWILRSRREVNWFMLTIAILLFAFSTGELAISALAFTTFNSHNEMIGEQLLIATVRITKY